MNIVITVKASGLCDQPIGIADTNVGASAPTGYEKHWAALFRSLLIAALANYSLKMAEAHTESEYVKAEARGASLIEAADAESR